jgi:hypothetical protein
MENVITKPKFAPTNRKSDESIIRYVATQRGLDVYLSTRLCPTHGNRVIRDLAGCCTNCLAEGSSRSRARR